jgi:hypothetical protein
VRGERADPLARGPRLGEDRARQIERVEQLVVPLALAQIEDARAAGLRVVGDPAPQSRKFSQSESESSVVRAGRTPRAALRSHASRGAAWIGSGHMPVAASTASPRCVAIGSDSPIARASRLGTAKQHLAGGVEHTEAKRIAVTATPATLARAPARASAARDASPTRVQSTLGVDVVAEPAVRSAVRTIASAASRSAPVSASSSTQRTLPPPRSIPISRRGSSRTLLVAWKRSNSTFTAPCSPCA